MGVGVVRASDRVAVWHNAAEEPFDTPEPEASTSTPPKGVEPELAGQDVAQSATLGYPNSNKFKTPANQLKKHLETTPHPSEDSSWSPPATKGIEDWAAKYPDFTKNYLKPQHNESLKNFLGDENHEKFLHHAPTPYSDALTKLQQLPAPKSNKFTIPANGLKKLLNEPHTLTQHVGDWLDSSVGQAWAKTYMQPQYDQALKSHLGDKDYNELKKHLSDLGSGKQQDTHDEEISKIQELLEPVHAPKEQSLGEKINNINDAVDPGKFDELSPEHQQVVLKALQKSYTPGSDTHMAVQELNDEHFGKPEDQDDLDQIKMHQEQMQPQGLGDKIKAVFPNLNEGVQNTFNQGHPDTAKKMLQNIIDADAWGSGVTPGLQKVMDEHFGDNPDDEEEQPEHPAFTKLMQVIDPGSEAGKVMHSPEFKQWFHTYLSPGEQEDLGNQPIKLYNTYKKSQEEMQPQGLGDKMQAIVPNIGSSAWNKIHQNNPESAKQKMQQLMAYGGYTSEQKKALHKVYLEHFGGGQGSQQAEGIKQQTPNNHYDALLSVVHNDPWQSVSDLETYDKPEFKEWFNQQDKLKQKAFAKDPSKAVGYFKSDTQHSDGGSSHEDNLKSLADMMGQQHHYLTNVKDYKDWEDSLSPEDVSYFVEHPNGTNDAKYAFEDHLQNYYDDENYDVDDHSPYDEPPSSAEWEQQLLPQQGIGDKLEQLLSYSMNPTVKEMWNSGDMDADNLGHLKTNNPDIADKLQQVWNEHHGLQGGEPAGEEQQPDGLTEGVKSIFPNSDFPLDPVKQKAQLESWLKYLPGTPGYENYIPKLQQLYDQYFGGGETQTQGGNQDSFLKAVEEAYGPTAAASWATSHSPADHANYLNSVIQGGGENAQKAKQIQQQFADYLGAGQGQLLDKHFGKEPFDWTQFGPEYEQYIPQIQQLYDQNFGGGGQAPTESPATQPQMSSVGDAILKTFGENSSLTPLAQSIKSSSPEEGQKLLQDAATKAQGTSVGKYLQQIHDKHFGGGSPESPSGQGLGDKLMDVLGPIAFSLPLQQTWNNKEKNDPQEAQLALKGLINMHKGEDVHPALQQLHDEHFGEQMPQQSGFDPQALAKDLSKMYGSTPDNIKINGVPVFTMTPEQAQWGFQVLKDVGGPGADKGGLKALQSLFDKHLSGTMSPGQGGQGEASSTSDGSLIGDLKAAFPNLNGGHPSEFTKFVADPDGAKATLQAWANDNGPAGVKAQQILDKHFGQEPFDWAKFGPEFKAINPNSSWATGPTQSPEAAEAKLKNVVDAANSIYPNSNKTKQLNELYKKYFGDGIPAAAASASAYNGDTLAKDLVQALGYGDWENLTTNGDEKWKDLSPSSAAHQLNELISMYQPDGKNAFADGLQHLYDKHFGQGIPSGSANDDDMDAIHQEMDDMPQEPAKPFKSEEVNPEDLQNWADNKPQDAAQWKQFSTWWGNTKLSPEQEGDLYDIWFNKQGTDPAQATAWFQSVFEHNSNPSEGDLGVEHTPSWAHNSWAFGKDADQEWPVFKEWASKHPGIPKGTSIKQKVQIWNGLSPEDKEHIAQDYLPENPVDTKSVLSDLQAAYPESNWDKWSGMTQGQLSANVKNLANKGFGPAIAAYNKYFGGDMEMPEEAPEGEEQDTISSMPVDKVPPSIPQIHSGDIPSWAKPSYKFGKGKKAARNYSNYLNWAQSVGGSFEQANANYSHFQTPWNSIPQSIKNQLEHMPAGETPWEDMDGFNEWLAQQPTAKAQLQAIDPEKFADNNLGWGWGKNDASYASHQFKDLKNKIDAETDPEKKNAMIGLYQQYFPTQNQGTLAETLKNFDPNPDIKKFPGWDQYLKGSTPEDVAKLIKKKLKTETDPEKWIQYVDTFNKYFSSETSSGHAKINSVQSKNNTGAGIGSNPGALKQLHYWKTQLGGDPKQDLPYLGHVQDYEHNSPFLQSLEESPDSGSFPAYKGWTPPEGVNTSSFKADPAMMGDTSHTTYQAPSEATSGHYKKLMDTVKNKSKAFSSTDIETFKSQSFRNWFDKAPKAYRETFQHNPAMAIDDFAEFMKGSQPYSPPPMGGDWSDVPLDKTVYQLNHPATDKATKKEKGKWPAHTVNPFPSTSTSVGRPDEYAPDIHLDPNNANQLEIPLPGGGQWGAKGHQPLYRWVPIPLGNANHTKGRAGELLRAIKHIVHGTPADKNPNPTLVDYHKHKWEQDKGGDPSEQWGESKPSSSGPKEPESSALPATYDHPDLADLVLEYLSLGSDEGGYNHHGLGIHWTTDEKQGHFPPSSIASSDSQRATLDSLPVAISAEWPGAGEDYDRSGGANGYPKEKEITLSSGAKVKVNRLELKHHGDQKYVDIMNHDGQRAHLPGPHWRTASLSRRLSLITGGLDEKNPSHLFDLAQSWGVAHPELYGIPISKAKDFIQDLSGAAWGWKEMAKEHGFGIENPRRKMASLEDAIERLAAAPVIPKNLQNPHWLNEYQHYQDPEQHYQDWLNTLDPDELDEWGKDEYPDNAQNSFENYLSSEGADQQDDYNDDDDYNDYEDEDDEDDDDYEYSKSDFGGDLPEPSGDRPQGWPKSSPLLKNDDRGRQYFPHTG